MCQVFLEFHSGEPFDAEDGVQEKKQSEEAADVGQLWYSSNECVKQLLQTFVLFNDLKDSADPENPDHIRQGPDLQSLNLGRYEAEPGSNDNNEVEHIPPILEIVLCKSDQFNQGFYRVNNIEHKICMSQVILKFQRFTVPIRHQASCI